MKRTMIVGTSALILAGLIVPAQAQVNLDVGGSGSSSVTTGAGKTDLGIGAGGNATTDMPANPVPLQNDGQIDVQGQSRGSADGDLMLDSETTVDGQISTEESDPATRPDRQNAQNTGLLFADRTILGAKVQDRSGAQVGTVREVVQGPNGDQLIVVKVGGFLGFFGRDIAFTQNQLTVTADGSLRTQLSEADIDAMPEYDGTS